MIERLNLKRVYSSSSDNLLRDFYNPVLEHAIKYDRISGYFSPSVFAVCAKGLSAMFVNGGKMRLITSIEVDQKTFELLDESNDIADDVIEKYVIPEDPFELRTELEKNYYSLFISLLKLGVIELKIALTVSGTGILHEKIGIIHDQDNMMLSFSGSNNETVYGWTQNIENFKVFPEWEESSRGYFNDDLSKFENYWNGSSEKIRILSVDEALKQKIFKKYEHSEDVNELIEKIKLKERLEYNRPNQTRDLRDYQKLAIKHWVDQGYVSIFEMATGSGKTFTSLNALNQFKVTKGFLRCILVVPLVTLVEQWENEVRDLVEKVTIINATGANSAWKSDFRKISQSAVLGTDDDFILITTYSTFSTQNFRDLVNNYPNNDLILLADEMHNLVTENNISTASSDKFKYRLGLSATPTRLWKQNESSIVRDLFGGKSFVYSLEDAIKNKALVEYDYTVIPVHLTEEEFDEYLNLSKQASRLSHFASEKSNGPNPLATILTRRATIKKQAENKFFVLEQLIDSLKKRGDFHNALIYVDSNSSLTDVQHILTEKHIKSSKFTGDESLSQRNRVIKSLYSKQIEAIIAIKCLDEGVDIPSATIGIFLSNNTDPREYVQRLGRVLRRHEQTNKNIAYVYDFIVLPPSTADPSNSAARNLVKTEVKRVKFFEELAKNAGEVREELGNILDRFGYYFGTEELTDYNADESELDE
ncbi:DEAD/DEAH box helicase [bacterium]|nr:DEAD/DEAH box helicase [bacterium]